MCLAEDAMLVAAESSREEPARSISGCSKLSLKSVELRKCDDELKPEAVAILKDTRDTLDLVIVSDGMCAGGPLKFSIAR
jgi:hypothetical protein